jgi:hypothetical protein
VSNLKTLVENILCREQRAVPCGEPAAKDIKRGCCHLKIERRTVMAGIEVEVVIDGPQEKVFDVVTIAGLWPQWAVLARAVAGVTERPFQLGDPIYEFIRTPHRPAGTRVAHHRGTTGPATPRCERRTGPPSPTPSSGRATTPASGASSSLARCWAPSSRARTPAIPRGPRTRT